MALRNPALALFCAVVLLACGGGPVKRISPPTASMQQLALQADGNWRLLLRVQNFSNVEMTFSNLEATLEVDGRSVGELNLGMNLDIPGSSADVVETTFKPAAGSSLPKSDFAYFLHGTIRSSEPDGKYKFERNSRLSPAPGLANTWR